MKTPQTDESPEYGDQPEIVQPGPPTKQTILKKPLRLWPGVVAAVVLILGRFVVPDLAPTIGLYGFLGGLVAILAIAVWWLFFSRARWFERLGAVLLIALTLFATSRLVHISISNGAMGYLFYVLAVPILSLALVAWAVATRNLSDRVRRASLVITILLTCGAFTLVRTGGLTANFDNDFHWRWSKTPEDQLLAHADEPTAPPVTAPAATTESNWPGFRGPDRDSVVRGVQIETDWSKSPPVELWRRPVGPGWSSFAVRGDLFYTQEQRGNDEIVSCYNVTTGKPVWKHRDAARFWESNAGAGPRGTPTLSNGRVYSLGATGIVNALDASNGAVVWSHNAASDTKTKIPGWGFASSPLVIENVVVVATAGNLVAYDVATGERRWVYAAGGSGYSSPHLVKIGGTTQVLLLNGTGAVSFGPADGQQLWEHHLPPGPRIVQPAMTADGDVLLHDGEGSSMRRVKVAQGSGGWTTEERWESVGLNPYFSDFVVHHDHAFGFAGSNIACIDLKDGNRKWSGGSYGHGQLVLLADQNLLLVLSEEGELALVKATPDQFTEMARFKAIEGKTWNHPVLAGDILLVRNAEEMAAFRMPSLQRRGSTEQTYR